MSCMCHAAGRVLSGEGGGGGLPCEYVCCCTSVTADGARGWGWEVLWYLLLGDFLYFWSYPEEVEQRKVGPACDV